MTQTSFQKILRAIQKDGTTSLHVLSDFDRTLTKPYVNGKKVPSLISVLRDHNYLTPDYTAKARALFEKYHPIEMDMQIEPEEKKKSMHEWWMRHFELLIASGLTRDNIRQAMSARHARLRDGAHEFFDLLRNNGIPLIIMSSSGLGVESIQFFLEAEHEMDDNVSVISNQYEWNDSGKAIGIKQPIIHGLNKDETLIQNFPDIFKRIEQRTNIILLGNSPSDLGMASGFAHTHLFSIGFLNAQDGNSGFDMELDSQATLTKVTRLLSSLIK
ncbi:MAG: hypothetical protein WC495_03570 [Patescibacteria group bacterium]|jgi:5'-nucleotidase